jgi:predicted nucleotidyltransferase component of viral defense system
MKLHLNPNDFKAAIVATSEKFNIREVFIEKDYWVTYILKNLSNSSFKDRVVFKGGTSLSKAYKIIDRFSEDIDLAVVLSGENDNQTKTLIQKIEKTVASSPLKEIEIKGKTSKGSRFRKTVWEYPKETREGSFGDASQNLLLEVNSFAQPFPHEKKKIRTYIADFLQNENTGAVAEYQLEEFDLSVLNFKRTFAEKIAGIARACFESDDNLSEMKNKIRHLYDIAMLYRNSEIKEFIDSKDFRKVYEQVKKDDAKINSPKEKKFEAEWADAILFKSPKETLKRLKDTYENQFSTLIFRSETSPTLDELEQVILKVTSSNK